MHSIDRLRHRDLLSLFSWNQCLSFSCLIAQNKTPQLEFSKRVVTGGLALEVGEEAQDRG